MSPIFKFEKGKMSECLQNSQTVTGTFHKNYGSSELAYSKFASSVESEWSANLGNQK